MNIIGQKHLRSFAWSCLSLVDISDYAKDLFIHFLKGGSFNSIVLVRQSLKLCQNASYPRCHPDLNNLEGDKTHAQRRNHLLTTSAFKEAASPHPLPFSWSIFFSLSVVTSVNQAFCGWERGRGGQWSQGEDRGKETWNILEQLLKKDSLSVCGLGERSLFLFSLLISNLLFTPFYKLESLRCSKGCKTNRCSARIKLLCCRRLAGLLAVLTSSATAECQMIQEILVLFWPKPYETFEIKWRKVAKKEDSRTFQRGRA